MYEKLEECPSCNHTKFSNHQICLDHTVSGESFALVKCDKCQLIFTNPRPDKENIGKYYKSDNYISHTDKANNLINLVYKQVRAVTLKQKINLLKRYSRKINLLDFGCGTGTFLSHAQASGYNITGYEPDPDARLLAEESLNIQLLYKTTQLKEEESYDIITAWHVIEHVHDLKKTLKTIRKVVTKDGYIFIAVPNPNSFDAEYYKEYWAAYDVPRHLYHFTKDSFEFIANKCKLKVIATHPMKFDSYYVSLLSEKYKNNKNKFANALNTGKKSNNNAKTSGEYSSLIYVLKK